MTKSDNTYTYEIENIYPDISEDEKKRLVENSAETCIKIFSAYVTRTATK